MSTSLPDFTTTLDAVCSCERDTNHLLWLVIVAGFVCFAMAWGIGANDVANAFATSVGSKAITLKQAVVIAAIFEFTGAFFLGKQVTDTVRKNITNYKKFDDEPDILLLGFFCALASSAIILYTVTKLALPVSTTQTIIGSIIGFAMVAKGEGAVDWTQVQEIIMFWILTPLISGTFGAITFVIIREVFLKGPTAVERVYHSWGLFAMLVFWIMSFFMLMKGLDRWDVADDLGLFEGAWISLLIGIGIGGIIWIILWKTDLLRRHMFEGKDMLANTEPTQTSRRLMSYSETRNEDGYGTNDEIAPKTELDNMSGVGTQEYEGMENGTNGEISSKKKKKKSSRIITFQHPRKDTEKESKEQVKLIDERRAKDLKQISRRDQLKNALMSGMEQDVHAELSEKELEMIKNSEKFDPKIERGFQYLQVISASLDILAHGSNDVANAIAPFAAVVALYDDPVVDNKVNVKWWILLLGGLGMVTGLSTYGYKVIKSIGVRLISMSCARGYVIELASALVVIIASWYGYPASTTHAQVGATMGVGLIEYFNKKNQLPFSKVVNWRLLGTVLISWVFALLGGAATCALLFSFLAYTPNIDNAKKVGYL